MRTEIINGVTVIHTGSTGEEIINKTGHIGVTIYEKQNRRFRSEIAIGRKKYCIGFFDTLEQAMKAREIADQKKAEGKLIEWIKQKPHGNSGSFYDYWKTQFNEYDQKK